MLTTKPAKEVIVRMANEIGALNRMAKVISDKGVDILAISAWVEGPQAVIRLVTVDNLRVVDALRANKYEVREADVLVTEVPHKPGMLHYVTDRLAQGGIDIHHLYETVSQGQERGVVVFATANNDRAMVLLNA